MRRFSLLGALAIVAGSTAICATLPDAVPVEVFAALPSIEKPQLSPDGTKLAGKIAVDGKQMLLVQDLFGRTKPGVLAQSKHAEINWWRWVNDNWLIVSAGDNQNFQGHPVYVTRLVRLSADMTIFNLIDGDRNGIEGDNVLWIAQDGSARILLSKQTGARTDEQWYPSVYDVDVATNTARLVVSSRPDVWDWRADSTGNVRYGVISENGKKVGVLYRGPGQEKFERVMLGKRESDTFPVPIVYKADGSALAIDNGDGYKSIYELALPAFKLGRKLYGDVHYDINDYVLNPTANDLSGVGLIDTRERFDWFDPTLKDIQQGLDKTLGRGNGRIVSWSRDRKKLLVEVGTPSQAGALYYWDTDGATMHRIAWINNVLKDRVLSPVSTVEYKARDGVSIEAVVTLPRDRVTKNLPLIVMPHGGPGARDSEAFDWWAQFLAEQGYAVIQPNYRGSTGYGKAFLDLGKGQWGLKMQDDLLDSITYLARQGIADPKRVCIVGGSYGGYAAMRGAQRDGAFYRCAVSYAGLSDLGAMLRFDRNLLGDGSVAYWKKLVPDFAAVSPRFHAKEFGAPILIVHGAADRRVPVDQSRLMASELHKAGKPYEYLEQSLGDHHFSRAEDRLEFLIRLKAFLDKYNPA